MPEPAAGTSNNTNPGLMRPAHINQLEEGMAVDWNLVPVRMFLATVSRVDKPRELAYLRTHTLGEDKKPLYEGWVHITRIFLAPDNSTGV